MPSKFEKTDDGKALAQVLTLPVVWTEIASVFLFTDVWFLT